MIPRIAAAVCLFLAVGFALASAGRFSDSYNDDQYEALANIYEDKSKGAEAEGKDEPDEGGDETPDGEDKPDEGEDKAPEGKPPVPPVPAGGGILPKPGVPGVKVPDDGDIVAAKFRGFCHWGIGVYFKPGKQVRCNCMKCTCKTGGNWDCGYNFAYCPYYYCGNQIYNPLTQICCCGKVHDKKADHRCCGYFYYYSKNYKCCNYYSVKSIKSHCPRDKI